MQLQRDEAAEEVGQHGDCRCRCRLVGDGVIFWPVGEEFHGVHEISFSPVALQEMYSDVKCCVGESGSTSGSGNPVGGTGVTLLTLPLVFAP